MSNLKHFFIWGIVTVGDVKYCIRMSRLFRSLGRVKLIESTTVGKYVFHADKGFPAAQTHKKG